MHVRILRGTDAAAYHPLRLRALQGNPEAFGRAYEDEVETALDKVAAQLESGIPDRATFGAFARDQLVGIVDFARWPGRKTRHRAMLGSMYVADEWRGNGVGRALMKAVLAYAHEQPDLEELILAVTVGNESARRFYRAAGFVPSHVEQRYIKWNEQYYDIEWMTRTF